MLRGMFEPKYVFTFNWKIENFSMLPHRNGESLKSPVFKVHELPNTQWFIRLYPRDDAINDTGDENVSCFLEREDLAPSPGDFDIDFVLIIVIANGSFSISQKIKNINVDGRKGYGKCFSRKDAFKYKHDILPQDVLTIQCRMWEWYDDELPFCAPTTSYEDQINESNAFQKLCSTVTRMEVKRRKFTWSIKNINRLWQSDEGTYCISESALEGFPSLKLSVRYRDLLSEYLHIEILQTSVIERLVVKCKITVLTANKEYRDSYEATHLFGTSVTELWCFPQFLEVNNLMEKKYIVNNALGLQFEFAFSRPGNEYHLEVPCFFLCVPHLQVKPAPEFSHLSAGICQLYERQKFCDVTLRVGERSFPCHKLVLCAQSPVFRAMFEDDMLEKNTGLVDIKDTYPDTVERMLTFLHSGIIRLEGTMATLYTCELYEVADKYQILPLKLKCSRFLLASLSVSSVCDVLAIAHRYQDDLLMVDVQNFLSIHASETFRTPQWKIFMDKYPKLSGEIMLQMWMEKPN